MHIRKSSLVALALACCSIGARAQYTQYGIPYAYDERFADYIDAYNINESWDEEGKSNDFGLDLSLDVAKKFGNRLDASLGVSLRTQDNSRDMQRRMVSLGIGYKVIDTKQFDLKTSFGFDYYGVKKLSATSYFTKFGPHQDIDPLSNQVVNGFNYRQGYKVTDAYWRGRQRYSLALSASYKPNKRWTFTLKETLQYSHYNSTDSLERTRYTTGRHKWRENCVIDDTYDPVLPAVDGDEETMLYYDKFSETINDDGIVSATTPENSLPYADSDRKSPRHAKDRFMLRSKLTAEYNVKGLPLNPFASIDYGVGLNYTTQKWKYTVGLDWKVSKQHKISLFYRFQHENDDDEPNGHLLGVGYKITL